MAGTRKTTRRAASDWADLPDDDLLKLRICDLELRIEGTDLEERVRALHGELASRGLKRFQPRVYLGDEWFTPEGVSAISIPFFLAHPRLMALEKKFMLEVEGGTPEWCMKLLRHEAGHCFDHAYRLSRRPAWRKIFGNPKDEYDPDSYRPRRYSKSYVLHLDNWYSQSHPDEDFAETFAVWLTPGLEWEARYARWAVALEKLRYIDRVARRSADRDPRAPGGPLLYSAAHMRSTLDRFYRRRIRENQEDYPDFFDRDLRKIFDGAPDLPKKDHDAGRFLARHRRTIVETVSRWTGEKKYAINALVKRLTARCGQTDLRLGRTEAETGREVAAYLATLVTHHLCTGHFKRTV